ncbi:proline dehydrogenase [Coemansia sp. RSA 2599]|nr:proline dehydrogenase [Coemansia sp. RSA 2599]
MLSLKALSARSSIVRRCTALSARPSLVRCCALGTAQLRQQSTANTAILKPDPSIAFEHRSLGELATLWAVYQACSSPRFVSAAPGIMDAMKDLRLSWLSNAIIRKTFFAWFCAGETESEIIGCMGRLRDQGIGSLIGFSAEADLSSSADDPAMASARSNVKADAFAKEYANSIRMAAKVPGAIAAVKLTSLVDPAVMFRVSAALETLKGVFAKAQNPAGDAIRLSEFLDAATKSIPGKSADKEVYAALFSLADQDHDGLVDWVDMQSAFDLGTPAVQAFCINANTECSPLDLQDFLRLIARAHGLIRYAADQKVRVFIDAEHSYFQQAIDHVAGTLQREFNGDAGPLVYNTYQMYRVDTPSRLEADYRRSQREKWRFALKLVRGAYMHLERTRAKQLGYTSPIHTTIQDTHTAYDRMVELILGQMARAQHAGSLVPALFAATHNNGSIENTLRLIRSSGVDMTGEPVMFGQLLGMQDATSYALAKMGVPVYKYVPYGPLDEVMPFLVRRALENSAVSSSIRGEGPLVLAEIRRRLLGGHREAPSSSATNQ